ncbi:MAG: adenylate/guanylate cyclase domain-containing protein, partial [bacterium]
NHDTGVPAIERRADAGVKLTNARRRLRLIRLGFAVEWEEEPFEWIRPFRFGVMRRYLTGPITTMRVLVELAPIADGSRLIYQVWAQPRNWFGLIAIPVQIGVLSAHSFDTTIRRYDQMTARSISAIMQPANAHFAPGGRERLASLRDALLAQGASAALVGRLVETIETADEFTLAQLRPYALADLWQASRRSVLELCLMATRAGLLEFRWKLLCPLCRGAQESSTALRDLKSQVHCESCNIDFTANFERSVELTFRPSPAVREIEASEFCVGGPQITPHIVAQQILPAGAQRRVTLALETGRYRLRTIELAGGQYLTVAKNGSANAIFRAEANGWPDHEISLSTQPELHFENATPREQLFILERMTWSDQAVTAAEVIALQLFRDLFASEALRPGEEFSVGSLAIVFTDLRGSTKLYREIGDAVAFGCVLNHFDILKEAIATEGGAVVKTIGDAVMAVFRRPVSALRALLAAQQKLASPADGSRPLPLKAGVHYGPCIAVTLNDRLDYFGSTINIAARLEGQSSGNNIIISTPVRNDPEVIVWLEQHTESIRLESLETQLKGFDEQKFALWRLAQRRV